MTMSAESTRFIHVIYIASTPQKVFEAITPRDRQPLLGRERLGLEARLALAARARQRNALGRAGRRSGGKHPALAPGHHLGRRLAGRQPGCLQPVTFDIVPYQDMVRLTVTHEELEPGSGMDTGIRQGWPIVLSSLKSLLETGKGWMCLRSRTESCRNRRRSAIRRQRSLAGQSLNLRERP
jgi:uncharacterized protein YndB with AHSA1/START domain